MASTFAIGPVPSRNADMSETWAYLSMGIDLIMSQKNITITQGIPFHISTNLYTTVYNFLTSSRVNYDEHGEIQSNEELLYNKLRAYLVEHLTCSGAGTTPNNQEKLFLASSHKKETAKRSIKISSERS
ncbi:hypothetical protein C0995_000209 [Termitomyces sp. Mi166|nr:hypothetical protein C0995_000209 [Termitomyces sp. Mi166\